MFERYSETARRAVFFARYEAGRWGSSEIETEHLLLGIFRIDSELALRILHSQDKIEAIRNQIETHRPPKPAVQSSVDLPVSNECKRVLTYAKKASAEFKHDSIGPEHLLLGIVREENCFAATVLRQNGITRLELNAELLHSSTGGTTRAAGEPAAPGVRNLTAAAKAGELGPLIGRDRELGRVVQILARRTKNNVALVGEPGVGRTAIVEGLAQRFVDRLVPPALAERPILTVDAVALIDPRRPARTADRFDELLGGDAMAHHPILCIEGLLDLAATPSGWGALEAAHSLESYLLRADFQCVATGSPRGFQQTVDGVASLARHFEAVAVLPPDEAEAIRILLGIKGRYEKFHDVLITDGAIEAAVRASGLFLAHRFLADRAIDLIDEAGARARVRREMEPAEIVEVRKRIRALMRSLETAIANHEYEKAGRYSEEERRERALLERLQAEYRASAMDISLTASDIEQAVAERAGIPAATVRTMLLQTHSGRLRTLIEALAGQIPIDGHEWVPFLAAYLANCTPEEAGRLAETIRALKETAG